MIRFAKVFVLILAMSGRVAPAPLSADEPTDDEQVFAERILPFLNTYCTKCHGGDEPKADLSLAAFRSTSAIGKERSTWEMVLEMTEHGEMPPEDQVQPSAEEREKFVDAVTEELSKFDCIGKQYPGRVTIRRLNRAEYNNTIRDLVGVGFRPADGFPSDDVGNGFDNMGDVLSMSPILMEKYLAAAETIIESAFENAESRSRIVICQPDDRRNEEECARQILTRFATRAFRRPVADEELDRLIQLMNGSREHGAEYTQSLQLALQAVLTSSQFLFRVELDSEPDEPDATRELDDYELAARLSYFLWSSMPDDELFAIAAQNALRDDGVLPAQIRRMLADPKSESLVKNFAGQWLQLRSLPNMSPDPERYPEFDAALREAMRQETELFFQSVVDQDRSVLDFLDADYTFVNQRLARHYGLPDVEGDEFRRVSLTGQRGGVLTHGSILLLTSNPTRTSPVKRGKWILDNLLDQPPPPPPAGVEELNEEDDLLGSLRERMEQHRANPTCASCHKRMDPLGFGLENFDAIGGWRDLDGKHAIDASGILPSGEQFRGPKELMRILKTEKKDEFCRCLTRKMLTYALGRGLESYDRCAVDTIMERLAENDYRFSELVFGVVTSDPFRMRGSTGGEQ
jgi:hypothetical protein